MSKPHALHDAIVAHRIDPSPARKGAITRARNAVMAETPVRAHKLKKERVKKEKQPKTKGRKK